MQDVEQEKSRVQTLDASARRLPGEPGIWYFVLGDLSVFTLFFAVFLVYRADGLETFTASQASLNQIYGLINTLLLLSSSWLVANAVTAARAQNARRSFALLCGAILCAIGFAAIKVLEYGEKIAAGLVVTTNDFFMYYYMFTAIHFLHVLAGAALLSHAAVRARTLPAYSKATVRDLEVVATFWHVVDILWIVLFALLYLLH